MKLSRWILPAVVAILSTTALNAKTITLGVMGGTSHAKYNIVGDRGAINNFTGYHLGIGATLKIPIISISPELIYSNNQFEIRDKEVMGSRCEVRDQKLDVPVVAAINFLGPLQLEAGPVFSIYNEADVAYDGGRNFSEDIGRINPDMGYVVGIKLSLMDRIVLGARYYGHADHYQLSTSGYQIRSHTYTLQAGVLF